MDRITRIKDGFFSGQYVSALLTPGSTIEKRARSSPPELFQIGLSFVSGHALYVELWPPSQGPTDVHCERKADMNMVSGMVSRGYLRHTPMGEHISYKHGTTGGNPRE